MLRRGTALAMLVLAGATTLGSPGSAAAQGGLTASSPSAQAILASPPAAVELTFSAPPAVGGSHVAVLAADGSTLHTGALTATAERTLRQPVRISAPGDVTVTYHVEFAGGGEAAGSLRFSVGTGAAPLPADPAVERAAEAAVAAHGHGIDTVSAALLVVDGLVVLVVVALLYLRRPHRPSR